MGVYLWRRENVEVLVTPTTFTHGLGVAPAGEQGEVFIRHRTATYWATVLASSSLIVVLCAGGALPQFTYGCSVDVCVMAFHSILK
jgi:hypothetical protein